MSGCLNFLAGANIPASWLPTRISQREQNTLMSFIAPASGKVARQNHTRSCSMARMDSIGRRFAIVQLFGSLNLRIC